jgi:hypothetical protein
LALRGEAIVVGLALTLTAPAPGWARETSPLPPVLLRQARAFGPSPPILDGPAREADGTATLVTRQSIGCLLVGTAATTATALAGAENLVNVIGGGLVVAANSRVLSLAVLGVTFTTFCSIGGALTPLYLHLRETPVAPAVPPRETSPPAMSGGPALPGQGRG